MILLDVDLYLSPKNLDAFSPTSVIISDADLIASFACNFLISFLTLL